MILTAISTISIYTLVNFPATTTPMRMTANSNRSFEVEESEAGTVELEIAPPQETVAMVNYFSVCYNLPE